MQQSSKCKFPKILQIVSTGGWAEGIRAKIWQSGVKESCNRYSDSWTDWKKTFSNSIYASQLWDRHPQVLKQMKLSESSVRKTIFSMPGVILSLTPPWQSHFLCMLIHFFVVSAQGRCLSFNCHLLITSTQEHGNNIVVHLVAVFLNMSLSL